MRSSAKVILALVLIAAASSGLYIWQSGRHQKALDRERVQSEEWERQLERAANENADLLEKAERNVEREAEARRQAEDARRMAELKAKEEEERRQKRITELNERLIEEADERRKAEASLVELAEKMKALEAAQIEAQEKLSMLAETYEGGEDIAGSLEQLERIREELKNKEQVLAQMASDKRELEERYEEALQRQIATGEEIIRESSKGDRPADLLSLIRALLEALGIKKGNKKPNENIR